MRFVGPPARTSASLSVARVSSLSSIYSIACATRAAKGAASMNVQVGYMTDPVPLPGLAHFCEHMLFLGTRRFPSEGDFERLVASNGGSNNAYTAAEETNYFFDVQGARATQRSSLRSNSREPSCAALS